MRRAIGFAGLGLVTVKTQVQQYGLMFGALLWPLFGVAGLSLISHWRSHGTLAGTVALLVLAAGAVGACLLSWWTVGVGLLLGKLLGSLALTGVGVAAGPGVAVAVGMGVSVGRRGRKAVAVAGAFGSAVTSGTPGDRKPPTRPEHALRPSDVMNR